MSITELDVDARLDERKAGYRGVAGLKIQGASKAPRLSFQ